MKRRGQIQWLVCPRVNPVSLVLVDNLEGWTWIRRSSEYRNFLSVSKAQNLTGFDILEYSCIACYNVRDDICVLLEATMEF